MEELSVSPMCTPFVACLEVEAWAGALIFITSEVSDSWAEGERAAVGKLQSLPLHF